MSRKSARLLNGNITDLLIDLITNYATYIIVVGGVWLVLGLLGLIANPDAGFNSLFNQEQAFTYSGLIFTVLIIRQKLGELFSAKMNTIVAEIIALVITAVPAVALFSGSDINTGNEYVSLCIFIAIRYILIQAYFDRGITRKSYGHYKEFAKIRRFNLLPAIMSLMVFLEFATNRYPKTYDALFLGMLAEIVASFIIISLIKRRTKKRRILPQYFAGAKRLVLDADLAELCTGAFLHMKQIEKARSSVAVMFGDSGYGFSEKTLITDLDTYLFCRKLLPEMNNRNVLIHIRKNIENYGPFSQELLEGIADKFTKKGFTVYFQPPIGKKSTAQSEFESRMAEKYVFINKDYNASLETVINSDDYNSRCAEHIRTNFGNLYSQDTMGSILYNTVQAQLRQLISEYSLLDMFYELIQTAELCVHLTCLCALSDGISCSRKAVEKLSLGTMVDVTRRCTPDRRITDENIKESVNFIETLCGLNSKGVVNEHRVFQCIVCLRNRYLGHGTMTYSVSEELVYHLTTVSSYIANICCELLSGRFRNTDLTTENVPFTEAKSALIKDGDMYFYNSYIYDDKAEYINPLNGQLYQNCNRRIISTCMNKTIKEGSLTE